jgi:hypothetical protein
LRHSIEPFDAGFRDEALRMADAIRVLVHDPRPSTSLVTNLGVKTTARLMSTSTGVLVDRDVMFQFEIGMTHFGDGTPIRPSLGEIGWRLVPADESTQLIHVFDGWCDARQS